MDDVPGLQGPHRIREFLTKEKGFFPNNPRLKTLLYRGAFIPTEVQPHLERLLRSNGWETQWEGPMGFEFPHYHLVHEAIAVMRGSARIQLGHDTRLRTEVAEGDFLIIPAGVAHQALSQNKLHVVGAYPQGYYWDLLRGNSQMEFLCAQQVIEDLPLPRADPLYGSSGPLSRYW